MSRDAAARAGALLLLGLTACRLHGPPHYPVCDPLVTPVGDDEPGPQGLSAADVLDRIDRVGTFVLRPSAGHDYADLTPLAPLSWSLERGDRTASVRSFAADRGCDLDAPETEFLVVPLDVRVTSGDGTLDLRGEQLLSTRTGEGAVSAEWGIWGERPMLVGVTPAWLEERARHRSGERCPDLTVGATLGGRAADPELVLQSRWSCDTAKGGSILARSIHGRPGSSEPAPAAP